MGRFEDCKDLRADIGSGFISALACNDRGNRLSPTAVDRNLARSVIIGAANYDSADFVSRGYTQ